MGAAPADGCHSYRTNCFTCVTGTKRRVLSDVKRESSSRLRPHLIALNKLQCVFAVIWPLVRWFGFKMLSSRDTAAETSRELLGAQKAKNAAHQSWRDPYLSYESCPNTNGSGSIDGMTH